ncbi:hypothetical protein BGZ99_007130 [Dissophora globulifera]|uniref:Uncharacterized protein n=1 Tax=Dissophora globulifera TaxID=979702 RepID=A0A9P6RSS2_9FUNG|nr:hypothetical protein BGZ99_007130 [Dissophora globulifera]
MKISTTFIFNVATAVAALLALATPAHTAALPGSSAPRIATMPQPAPLEKRQLSGVNNFDCKLTPQHPRPLLLVHATLLTQDSWWTFTPVLIREGYCVFAVTYGRYKNIPLVAGIGPVEDSAQEIGTFADQILSHYNVTQLDYVGHSQGGILGRYWLKYLGGAGKVNRMVGISPINHGTTLDGIATIAQALRIFYPAQPIFDSFAPAFYELVNTSEFMAKLNLGGDVGANVIHSNIATRFDEVVTPYQTCYQNDAGVTNTLLQDLCIFSINEHLTMINSKVVLRWVMNQLDPANAKTSNCFAGLYL